MRTCLQLLGFSGPASDLIIFPQLCHLHFSKVFVILSIDLKTKKTKIVKFRSGIQ